MHTVDADNRIYRSRVLNLRFILQSHFGVAKADAEALDHAGLVNTLIELFQTSQKAAAAAVPTAAPRADRHGYAARASPAAAAPSEPPPPGPVPLVQSSERSVPMNDVTRARIRAAGVPPST